MALSPCVHRLLASVTGQKTKVSAHDTDGNLTSDGEMTYEYDAENRLLAVCPTHPLEGDLRTEMSYDYMGRRVRKVTRAWGVVVPPPASPYPEGTFGWLDDEVVDDLRYIYDGLPLSPSPLTGEGRGEGDERGKLSTRCNRSPPGTTETVRKYAWGCDLSGLNGAAANVAQASSPVLSALHGAGGIGGLLAVEDFTPQIGYENSRAYIYCYDGNGNVGQLVTWKTGDPELVEEPGQLPWTPYNLPGRVAERFEYDPYGGTLLADDDYAVDNPFRFSTKYYDAQPSTAAAGERGLYYYGYRYYSPRLGRWVNRDPIGEVVGFNDYLAMQNNLGKFVDLLGLFQAPANPYLRPRFEPPLADRMSSRGPIGCRCGEEIGDTLRNVFAALKDEFLSDKKLQSKVCRNIWDIGGWDMPEFFETGGGGTGTNFFANHECGTGECAGTVTVDGKCYRATEVNYLLWGQINSLCHSTVRSWAAPIPGLDPRDLYDDTGFLHNQDDYDLPSLRDAIFVHRTASSPW